MIAADYPIGKSAKAEQWAFTFCYLSIRTNETIHETLTIITLQLLKNISDGNAGNIIFQLKNNKESQIVLLSKYCFGLIHRIHI